jgi:hypothetical protein
MKNDIKNQSPEERMITTLRFAKNTLYNSGICGKFFQIAYYCEELITANQDTLEVSKLDALIDLHDFAERAKRNKMAAVDMIELIETIGTALKSNPVEIAA